MTFISQHASAIVNMCVIVYKYTYTYGVRSRTSMCIVSYVCLGSPKSYRQQIVAE